MNQAYSRIKLQGLDPDMLYENILNKTENYGDELMNFGLITTDVTAGEVRVMQLHVQILNQEFIF